MAFMFPIVLLVLNVSSVAALWFGGDRIDAGEMQVGELIAFLSYLVQILMSVMMATFVMVMVPRAGGLRRAASTRCSTPRRRSRRPPGAGTELTGRAPARAARRRVPLSRAPSPVLSDISFTAAAGQTTAIIGSTGSGKTTLLNLVARLFDVTAGAVLVDGVDVRDLDPELLWSRIGAGPPEAVPVLRHRGQQPALRRPRRDRRASCGRRSSVAQATDFVAAMPGGLDAPIAQGGTNVSGGQRQRLAIARALVRRPEIYLFDDSFSALDLATDARLRAALAAHTADATVVIVAQRVSTIRDADQILVLEDGVQVGLGTHDELLAACPTYAEIVESQHEEDAA